MILDIQGTTNTGGQEIPSILKSHTILLKFADLIRTEPHSLSYFNNTFYNSTAGAYSLKNYFNSASYGELNITSAGITDWVSL